MAVAASDVVACEIVIDEFGPRIGALRAVSMNWSEGKDGRVRTCSDGIQSGQKILGTGSRPFGTTFRFKALPSPDGGHDGGISNRDQVAPEGAVDLQLAGGRSLRYSRGVPVPKSSMEIHDMSQAA